MLPLGVLEDASRVGCNVANDLALSRRLEADGVLAMASELAVTGFCITMGVAVSDRGMGSDVAQVSPGGVWPLVAPGAMVKDKM